MDNRYNEMAGTSDQQHALGLAKELGIRWDELKRALVENEIPHTFWHGQFYVRRKDVMMWRHKQLRQEAE